MCRQRPVKTVKQAEYKSIAFAAPLSLSAAHLRPDPGEWLHLHAAVRQHMLNNVESSSAHQDSTCPLTLVRDGPETGSKATG